MFSGPSAAPLILDLGTPRQSLMQCMCRCIICLQAAAIIPGFGVRETSTHHTCCIIVIVRTMQRDDFSRRRATRHPDARPDSSQHHCIGSRSSQGNLYLTWIAGGVDLHACMHAWKSHCICRFRRIKIIDTDVSSLMQTNATATTCILQPSTKDGVAFRGMYIEFEWTCWSKIRHPAGS